jgi:hypothetical protein
VTRKLSVSCAFSCAAHRIGYHRDCGDYLRIPMSQDNGREFNVHMHMYWRISWRCLLCAVASGLQDACHPLCSCLVGSSPVLIFDITALPAIASRRAVMVFGCLGG